MSGSARFSTEAPLPELREGGFVDSELAENPVKQRRSDLKTAMDRYGRCAAVGVQPAFMTSGLS
jgi:hypothetical protein